MSSVVAGAARPLAPARRSDPALPALPARPRPRLRVVPTPRPATPRAPFVAAVVGVLVLGLLSLLLLNTMLAQGAFQVYDLERQVTVLQDQQQAWEQRVASLASPRQLDRKARALGMVPTRNPAFLTLTEGEVLGKPTKGGGAGVAAPVPAAPPQATESSSDDHRGGSTTPEDVTSPRSSTDPVVVVGSTADITDLPGVSR